MKRSNWTFPTFRNNSRENGWVSNWNVPQVSTEIGFIQALGVAERMAAYVDGLEVDGPGKLAVPRVEDDVGYV